MRKLAIVGKGGLGREVYEVIRRINEIERKWEFVGYIVNDEEGDDIIGTDEFLMAEKEQLDVVIAIGSAKLREKLFNKYKNNSNLRFPAIIDPSVIITGKNVEIGQGTIICPGSILSVDIKIGQFCLINMGCTIAHDDEINDFVSINPGVNLSGFVKIGSFTEIGTGSQVVQGITIGVDVDVWAGTVIIKKVKDKSIMVGVPAKVVYRKE